MDTGDGELVYVESMPRDPPARSPARSPAHSSAHSSSHSRPHAPRDAPPSYDTHDLWEVYARCPPPSSLKESYTSPYAVPEGLTREEHLARRFPHGLPLAQPPPSPIVRRGETYENGYRAGEVEKGFLRLIDEEHMTHSRDWDMVSHKSRLARWHKGDDPPLPPPLTFGHPTTGGLVIRPGMPIGLLPQYTEHREPQLLKIHCVGLFATPVHALDNNDRIQFRWSVSRKLFEDYRSVFDHEGKLLFSVSCVIRGPYTRQWLFYPPGAFQRRRTSKSEPVLTVSLMDTDPMGEETMVVKFVSAITLVKSEQPGLGDAEKTEEKPTPKLGQMELVLRCHKVSRIWSLCTPEGMILAEVVPKSLNHINWMVWVAPRMDTAIGAIVAFVVTRRRNEQKRVDPGVAAAG